MLRIVYASNFWKAAAKNFVVFYCCKLEGDIFIIKTEITKSYQRLQPEPQLATMQSYVDYII